MASSPEPTKRLAPEERRRQLLDAALGVIDEGGFRAATVEAIARRANVARPMVYDLFGDLDGLLLALVAREEQRALSTLAEIVPRDPGETNPDELLIAGFEALLEAGRREPRTWRLVLLPPDGSPPALRARITENRERIARELEPLLKWGLARRGGPDGLDHEILARLLIAVAEDAARLALGHSRRFPPARLADAARGMLALLPAGGDAR
jgi:AcrR family transcriptional regulator